MRTALALAVVALVVPKLALAGGPSIGIAAPIA